MPGTSHYRVRGINCGKCNRTHTWYKYRVWREGKKVKEEYIGKCDQYGNEAAQEYTHASDTGRRKEQQRKQQQKVPPPKRRRTPYEILGVSYTATNEQIKKAYRELVKTYHPDRNRTADPHVIAEINVAYETLTKRY